MDAFTSITDHAKRTIKHLDHREQRAILQNLADWAEEMADDFDELRACAAEDEEDEFGDEEYEFGDEDG